ncbi:NIPSNAP family protein [Roseateles sp.]|uniref:NIPSNAP family protein n=1 Tax=Roseateles sp. TaxID=1971397 RepID=UPI003BA6F0CE
MPVIEIRSYRLVPGSRDRFHGLISQQSLPLMLEWGMDVVGFGPSLHGADSYFLIRAFKDLMQLEHDQAAFYASPAWREGPREAIVSLIASDSNVVMAMSQERIEALRDPSIASHDSRPSARRP